MKKQEALRQLKVKIEGVTRWIEIVEETSKSDPNYRIFCQVLENYCKVVPVLFKKLRDSIA